MIKAHVNISYYLTVVRKSTKTVTADEAHDGDLPVNNFNVLNKVNPPHGVGWGIFACGGRLRHKKGVSKFIVKALAMTVRSVRIAIVSRNLWEA